MDQSDSPSRPRLDQQAALEELERFGRDIQRYRAQREALGEEFETFVQSFKAPPEGVIHQDRPLIGRPVELTVEPAAAIPPPVQSGSPPPIETPAIETPVAATPIVETPVVETPAATPVDAATVVETPAVETVAVTTPVFETPATELSPPAMATAPEAVVPGATRQSPTPIAGIAAGAALLVGGVLLAAFLWNRGPGPSSEPAPAPDATATPAPEPAAPTSTPGPAVTAPAADPAQSELVAERQVWMRVIVDGERLFEREVPAGTKIPLKAEKTIVIRTGDAGAVKLSIRGGPPTALGGEGVVVTRSFTVPPRRPEGR